MSIPRTPSQNFYLLPYLTVDTIGPKRHRRVKLTFSNSQSSIMKIHYFRPVILVSSPTLTYILQLQLKQLKDRYNLQSAFTSKQKGISFSLVKLAGEKVSAGTIVCIGKIATMVLLKLFSNDNEIFKPSFEKLNKQSMIQEDQK